MKTPNDLVQAMRRALEARGGHWPRGFDQEAIVLVTGMLPRWKLRRPTADRILRRLVAAGGELRIHHAQLAAELGVARESVSRAVAELRDRDLVESSPGRIRMRMTDADGTCRNGRGDAAPRACRESVGISGSSVAPVIMAEGSRGG